MKKKTVGSMAIAVILLLGIAAYFRPLSFSGRAGENRQIQMVLNESGVRNGEPYIDSVSYAEVTTEQKSAILTVLENYTYRRTFGTLFSDGSLSDFGDAMISIYGYENDTLVASIVISSSGKIAVNDKTYHMKDAEQLIDQIVKIMEQTN